MKQYFVEGVVSTAPAKARARSKPELVPFARSYWANNAEEALRMACEELPGALWVEGPRLAKHSEEQRMRQAGAPELFAAPNSRKLSPRRTKR